MREINTIGIIMLFNGTTAPEGWLPCDGRLLEIDEYRDIFTFIRQEYGNDTRTDFNLPKLPNIGSCMHIICVAGDFPSNSTSRW